MKFVYLFGFPLSHSVSPAMQNAALVACGLTEWLYEKYPLPPGSEREMTVALRHDDVVGANVTIPHKQSSVTWVDELTGTAAEIGAVNTIFKREKRLIGDNTDAPGFIGVLNERNVSVKNANAFVIGAGGAASAVVFALAKEGARRIIVANRSPERAVDLANRVSSGYPRVEVEANRWDMMGESSIIINASAVGMAPREDESPIVGRHDIPRGAVAFDLVYNPEETRFLREAEEAGAKTIGGLEMLVLQGALSFERWTGCKAPLETMREVARKAMAAERQA